MSAEVCLPQTTSAAAGFDSLVLAVASSLGIVPLSARVDPIGSKQQHRAFVAFVAQVAYYTIQRPVPSCRREKVRNGQKKQCRQTVRLHARDC